MGAFSYDRRAFSDTKPVSESLHKVKQLAAPLHKAAQQMRLAATHYLDLVEKFEHHDPEAMDELKNEQLLKMLEKHMKDVSGVEQLAEFLMKSHEPH